jgi:adenylate cyclase
VTLSLHDIDRCFMRVLPGVIATCDRASTPNVNYVTQIQIVDDRHIALSYQFPTKTRLNLEENPRGALEVYDPLTLDAYRLDLRLDRIETSGPMFDLLAMRIEAVASYTGLAKVFRLRAAYVCEVLGIERRAHFLQQELGSPRSREAINESRGLRMVSDRISRARNLDELLTGTLAALDEVFGFTHSAILVPEDDGRLVTIASHGYGATSIGAEVRVGEGLIGVVAKTRTLLRILGLDTNLTYSRQVRAEIERRDAAPRITAEIPLPGLPDARSQMAIPLVVQDRLLGVIALEARDIVTFSQWHEPFLQVLANQIASAMVFLEDRERDDEDDDEPALATTAAGPSRSLVYFKNDDCVFVDDEYLIRNVPAKILWKLLRAFRDEGRTEFSNRELRLDPSLGLPAFKDNLESRLILLRKRLEQKCPEIRVVPTRRGRFALEVSCTLELVERETG